MVRGSAAFAVRLNTYSDPSAVMARRIYSMRNCGTGITRQERRDLGVPMISAVRDFF